MKRYLVLVLMLMVGVAAIVGSNAAYSTSVTLDDINIELVPPTTEPTPDPTPEPTPDPTPEPTPDPGEWTGEFELVIRANGAYRLEKPDRIGAQFNYEFINHTGSNGLTPIYVQRLVFGFAGNVNITDGHNVIVNKQNYNQYTFSNPNYWTLRPGQHLKYGNSTIATYPLVEMKNGKKTRTANPDIYQLIFTNLSIQIATDHYNGALKELNPSKLKITYFPPAPLTGWQAQWIDGVVFPPNWAPVH